MEASERLPLGYFRQLGASLSNPKLRLEDDGIHIDIAPSPISQRSTVIACIVLIVLAYLLLDGFALLHRGSHGPLDDARLGLAVFFGAVATFLFGYLIVLPIRQRVHIGADLIKVEEWQWFGASFDWEEPLSAFRGLRAGLHKWTASPGTSLTYSQYARGLLLLEHNNDSYRSILLDRAETGWQIELEKASALAARLGLPLSGSLATPEEVTARKLDTPGRRRSPAETYVVNPIPAERVTKPVAPMGWFAKVVAGTLITFTCLVFVLMAAVMITVWTADP